MMTYFRVEHHNWKARLRSHIGHEQYIENLFPDSIKDLEIDKIPFQRKWARPYNTMIGTGEGPGKRAVDWEVYTDGSLMEGKSGLGVAVKKNTDWLFTIRVPLMDATVFQAELKAIELAADKLRTLVSEGDIIRLIVDNQSAIMAQVH